MGSTVRNISSIAGKELRGYFVSPVAWVMMGLFALIFGYFFLSYLTFFVRSSMQAMMGGGPQTMNINMELIRPLLSNASVLVLFLLPMVTMRTYSEEKRSGTIELLLTSPLTDVEIILGKFLGAMGFLGVMLGVTIIHIAFLYMYGRPEWKPLVTAYLGLLLLGGCFVAVGLLISSLTKNQIVSGTVTFAVFLFLWVITWVGSALGPTGEKLTNYLSIIEHLDDFTKGVIDTSHVVYYLSFITFGLFLTAKSVDSERWRG
jgi:ABC-2 type transport system permease protein